MPSQPHFTPALFKFLRDLSKNNTREWFQANKGNYEKHIKEPSLRFIADLEPRMAKISPRIEVVAKSVGGSLQRLNRDTRFSKDKSPYKTSVGFMFGHDRASDLMLGYHLTLAPGSVKSYVGLWEPDGPTLEKIRTRIMVKPDEWSKAAGKKFLERFSFEGESLKRPPNVGGCVVGPDHPLLADLKRKSHAAGESFDEKAACRADFLDAYVDSIRAGVPLMVFLCKAVGVEF